MLALELFARDAPRDLHIGLSKVVAKNHLVAAGGYAKSAYPATHAKRRPLLLIDVTLREGNVVSLGSIVRQNDRGLGLVRQTHRELGLRHEYRFHPGRSRHLRLAQLTPEGWPRTHRKYREDTGQHGIEIWGRIVRPVARIGEIGGLRESVGESVGHIQPRAEFSRVYGLRMTHASLQNPQKVAAKKKPHQNHCF